MFHPGPFQNPINRDGTGTADLGAGGWVRDGGSRLERLCGDGTMVPDSCTQPVVRIPDPSHGTK
jgi:hypothetical protein